MFQTGDCPKVVDRIRGKGGEDSTEAGTMCFGCFRLELSSGFVPALPPTSCLGLWCSPNGRWGRADARQGFKRFRDGRRFVSLTYVEDSKFLSNWASNSEEEKLS
jgi:hypothetical protein